MLNEPYFRHTGDGEQDPPTQFSPEKPAGPDPVTPEPSDEGSETQRHAQLYALDKSDGQFKPLCWKDGKLVVDTELSDVTIELGKVKITDGKGTDVQLQINPDCSASVRVLPLGTIVNEFDDATSVPIGVFTTIVQFLVPTGKVFHFKNAAFSGENFGHFRLKVDGVIKDSFRTHDGHGVNGRFDWKDPQTPGGLVVPGDKIVLVEVKHNGFVVADFEARIYGRLV